MWRKTTFCKKCGEQVELEYTNEMEETSVLWFCLSAYSRSVELSMVLNLKKTFKSHLMKKYREKRHLFYERYLNVFLLEVLFIKSVSLWLFLSLIHWSH